MHFLAILSTVAALLSTTVLAAPVSESNDNAGALSVARVAVRQEGWCQCGDDGTNTCTGQPCL